jgi:hypothetical protein
LVVSVDVADGTLAGSFNGYVHPGQIVVVYGWGNSTPDGTVLGESGAPPE